MCSLSMSRRGSVICDLDYWYSQWIYLLELGSNTLLAYILAVSTCSSSFGAMTFILKLFGILGINNSFGSVLFEHTDNFSLSWLFRKKSLTIPIQIFGNNTVHFFAGLYFSTSLGWWGSVLAVTRPFVVLGFAANTLDVSTGAAAGLNDVLWRKTEL